MFFSVVGLASYLFFFAPGMGPMPWTINSEIYPLWARSLGNSLASSTNWAFNLLISMTFLSLTESITKQVTLLLLLFLFVPTSQSSQDPRLDEAMLFYLWRRSSFQRAPENKQNQLQMPLLYNLKSFILFYKSKLNSFLRSTLYRII